MWAGAAAPQYYETAPRAYSSVRSAPRRPARPLRREKRSWAGRVFSFATAVAVAVMLGAFIAGHIPKQSVTSALDVTSGSPSASGGAQGQTTAPAVAATDPAAETPVDGTLQPTNPAEVHYRCSLHYIASYKRMNCN